jgi:hypothetical protein
VNLSFVLFAVNRDPVFESNGMTTLLEVPEFNRVLEPAKERPNKLLT